MIPEMDGRCAAIRAAGASVLTLGEGEAFYQGERLESAIALERGTKASHARGEGRPGTAQRTQAMHAVGGLLLRAKRLSRGRCIGAMTLEALKGTPTALMRESRMSSASVSRRRRNTARSLRERDQRVT